MLHCEDYPDWNYVWSRHKNDCGYSTNSTKDFNIIYRKTGRKELSLHSTKKWEAGETATTTVASHCFLARETFCFYTSWADKAQAYCNEMRGTEWLRTSSLYHRSDLYIELHLTRSERVSTATMDCLCRPEGCFLTQLNVLHCSYSFAVSAFL